MNREKQIEKDELFGILSNTINGANFDDLSEAVYKISDVAGYRKQEWISVDERLPEDTQMCLAYATVYFVPDHVDDCDHCEQIIVTKYYKEFGFMDWDVHYWMPLPEAPKI